ncbi:MAG: response regulator [Betaproteobacteria bacterium]|nr:response regulator [Betaproteobacteria bacterium]
MDRDQKLRVLVADDHPDTRTTMSALLEAEGYSVRCVADGGAAVNAVREFRPHACILDIGLPGQTGYSVAGQLRLMYGSRRPLLIAMSGQWINPSEKLVAESVGFDHFMEKPAEPGHVLDLLKDLEASLSP